MDHTDAGCGVDLHALVGALAPIFGARRPTRTALEFLGLYLTPAAITRRRRRGTLPVAETCDAGRYYVDVLAVAELLVGGHRQRPLQAKAMRARRGRPRRFADVDRGLDAS